MEISAIATGILQILLPYAKKGATAVLHAVGEAGLQRAESLIDTLKQKLAGDREASDALRNFEEKPERYQEILADVLVERLEQNPELAGEMSGMLQEAGPMLNVLQELDDASQVVGARIGQLRSGEVKVTQKIGKGSDITGASIDTLG
jgi:hypothetical protein